VRPDRPYRALRAGVGAAVILVVVGLWAHGQATGSPLETIWQVVMLALVLAAAYSVFGQRTVENAVETAQELQGSDTEGDDGDA
jgi:hypothetical protein